MGRSHFPVFPQRVPQGCGNGQRRERIHIRRWKFPPSFRSKSGCCARCVNNTLFKNDGKNTGSGEFQIQYHATNNVFKNNIVDAGSQALAIHNFTTSVPQPRRYGLQPLLLAIRCHRDRVRLEWEDLYRNHGVPDPYRQGRKRQVRRSS
jgi:hypothetical protein